MARDIYLIADNIRSCLNVGALLRTAEGVGVKIVYLCGYSPYPVLKDDPRPLFLANKINTRIKKTALGAETFQEWQYIANTALAIKQLRQNGVTIVGLEQSDEAIRLSEYIPTSKIALIVGSEVDGISSKTLDLCDEVVQIPMLGRKESFNVSAASAMALYYLRYMV